MIEIVDTSFGEPTAASPTLSNLVTERMPEGLLPQYALPCETLLSRIQIGSRLQAARVYRNESTDECRYEFEFLRGGQVELFVRAEMLQRISGTLVDINFSGSSLQINSAC